MLPPKPDLSRIRHDLRTPINHILGYCEMLLELESLPERFARDLTTVRASGRQLLDLLNRYFNDDSFGSQQNFQQLQHELRTPVNHIIGYTELLSELAVEQNLKEALPDLDRIHKGASQCLRLVEEYLIQPSAKETSAAASESGAPSPLRISPFPLKQPAAAPLDWNARLLAVDDDLANAELLARSLSRCGAEVVTASNGLEALELLSREKFDLVLLDMLMPGLDGYEVLTRMKADPHLRHTPAIMISSLDQEAGIARCLEAGAEDFLTKPFNPVFLRARIGASLEKKRWHDREREMYEALRRSQEHLAAELAEAGNYVRSLLPPPEHSRFLTRWSFQPSADLGGDAFGYHWLDHDRFVVYLLDVCGHGVGAALLSVSVLNVLRAQSLPGVDFGDPASVMEGLNRVFQMDRQNGMYFTIWYGVWNLAQKEMLYSSAGHPPALLVAGPTAQILRVPGPPIGSFPEAAYRTGRAAVGEKARLIVFSDGVYELPKPDGKTQGLPEFLDILKSKVADGSFNPVAYLKSVQEAAGAKALEDDFSLLEVVTR